MSTATLPVSGTSLKGASVSPIVSDREWNAHILNQLAAGKLTQEQALAQLKTAPKSRVGGSSLHCKVSEKGGVSVYGLNARFPVTLYVEQWERLLAFAPAGPTSSRPMLRSFAASKGAARPHRPPRWECASPLPPTRS